VITNGKLLFLCAATATLIAGCGRGTPPPAEPLINQTEVDLPEEITVPTETAPPAPTPTATRKPFDQDSIIQLVPERAFSMGAAVRAVSISSDGVLVAGASGDDQSYEIGVWSLESGEQVVAMEGHTAIIWDVAFSPDGRYLASSSKDYTVRVWQVSDGAQVFRFDAPGEITSVAFTPDGRYLAFGGVENWPVAAVWVLQVDGWSQIAKVAEGWNIPAIVFTPDSRLMIAGGISRNMRAWYIPEGSEVYRLYYPGQVYDLALSPDARVLASAPCILSSANQCAEVELWLRDSGTGEVLKQVSAGSSAVQALTYSPDGGLLVAGNQVGWLQIWAMPEARPIGVLQLHPGTVEDLAFSPDGSRLVSAGSDGTICVWRTP